MRIFLSLILFLSLFLGASAHSRNLTIATYDSFAADWGMGPVIKEEFGAICGCTVTFKQYSSSLALIAALKANHLNDVDIILGFDQITYELNPFIKEHLVAHNIADYYWGDDKVIAYDYGTIAFITHKDEFDNLPNSWDALLEQAQDKSIIMIDPRASTTGQAILLDMALSYGDNLDAFLQKLQKKILTTTQSWSAAYGLFTEKEANIVLSYTTSPSYHRLVENDDSKIAIVKDKHVQQIELAAILNTSNNTNIAKDFLTYLTSAQAQQHIPTKQWMLPVNDAVNLPENYITQQEPAYYDTRGSKAILEKALRVFEQYF